MLYVGNNKVSHMETKIVEDLIDNFKKHFLELVMNRRKNYTFQGININITEENKLR